MTRAEFMRYRPDIDGLRTVAILPVVLFHAGVAWMPGGFVGVDVFFVISGFLITSLIVAEIEAGTFRIADFYRRRALRILPAYLAMIAGVLVAGWLIFFPDEARAFGRSLIWSALFLSNVYFWQTSDYFDAEVESAPLLHTWTLSVEEQFYLLLPLFLILVHRASRQRSGNVMLAVVLASFAVSILSTDRHEAAAFYLLPMRMWEFGLGALVALWAPDAAARERIPGRLRSLLALGGLAMIAVAAWRFDAETPFPGWAAILPAGGAALALLAAPGTLAGRVLSTRPMVTVGRISYSLYLWHWPVITFWRMEVGPLLAPLDVVVVIAMSVGLAVLSYLFVEEPFRTGRFRRARAWPVNATAAGTLAAAAVAGLLVAGTERWGRLPPALAEIADYIDYRSNLEAHPCLIHARVPGREEAYDPDVCLAASDGRPTMLVLGDSHAEHLLPALETVMGDVNLQVAASTGCRPLIGLEGDWYCPSVLRPVIEIYVPRAPIDTVLLSARWRPHEIDEVRRTVAWLTRHVDNVVILGPTPEYLDSFPRLLARSLRTGRDPDRFLDPEVRALDRQMAALDWGKARYVSLYDLICPDRCRHLTAEGVPYLADYGHYTRPAALEIVHDLVSGTNRIGY